MKTRKVPPAAVGSIDHYEQMYYDVTKALAEMLVQKRMAYGNNLVAGEKFLGELFPNGIPKTAYRHLLIVIRILDKVFRWANACKNEDGGIPFSETEFPFIDIAGYGIAGQVDKLMQEEIRKEIPF